MRLDFSKAKVSVKSIYFSEITDKCTAEVAFQFDFENRTPSYTFVPKFIMEKGDLAFSNDCVPGGLSKEDHDIVMQRALATICQKASNVFGVAITPRV